MYENENTQEMSLLDMMTALIKKWKLVVWVTLAAILLGCGFGLTVSLLGNRYYGARTEFFVSSATSNSYILSIMKSDSFAEHLLMDENNLPAEYAGTDLYNEAKASYEAVIALEKEIEALEDSIEPYEFEITKLSKISSEAQNAYNEALALLEMYKKADGEALATAGEEAVANHFAMLKVYEEELETRRDEKEQAKKDYNAKLDQKQNAEQQLKTLTRSHEKAIEKRAELFDKVHKQYISVPENAEKIELVKKYVSCGFVDEKATENDAFPGHAIIYVDIAVPGDEELASFLVEKVSEKTIGFVKGNVTEETECRYLTAFASAHKLKVYQPVVTTVKYGVIAGVAAAVIACVAIVAVFMMKPQRSNAPLPESNDEDNGEE